MSFSANVKQELSKINNLVNKKLVKAEFIGYLISINTTLINGKVKYSTESEYNINRFAKLLNNTNIQEYDISIQGKKFNIVINNIEKIDEIDFNRNIKLNKKIREFIKTEDLQKSIVRGVFLGSGSINNPEKKYHLEINFLVKHNALYINEILNNYGIQTKALKKENAYSLYIKDGEEISKFLAFIGANTGVVKFEEIRVFRDMRNNINRIVNCETANLNKTVNAAVKQIEDINIIKNKKKYGELKQSLKEVAELRLKNPDATLTELGKMLKKPIGKSGVNHRLKTISKIAEELK